jgi:hypothetical protein
MIIYRFGPDDLLRTRFAISPLFEATASLPALRDPARASLHLPWVREARRRTRGLELDVLHALVASRGYVPDFISPPPQTPLPDVELEIERVRRTPVRQMRREVGWRFETERPPPSIHYLLDHPRRGLDGLARTLRAYWEAAIAPFWDDMLAVLEDDIAHRARLLTRGGPLEMFGDLHRSLTWRDGALHLDRPYDAEIDLGGRGVLLVPSIFAWPKASAMFDPPWQPSLLYPPRGIGDLWAPARQDPRALAALLGARRAHILTALDREATTTDLARRMRASPAGVSEHLSILRDAGLVRPRRQGRAVLYARTAAGDGLVRASSRG